MYKNPYYNETFMNSVRALIGASVSYYLGNAIGTHFPGSAKGVGKVVSDVGLTAISATVGSLVAKSATSELDEMLVDWHEMIAALKAEVK